jgi:hypothetical protein
VVPHRAIRRVCRLARIVLFGLTVKHKTTAIILSCLALGVSMPSCVTSSAGSSTGTDPACPSAEPIGSDGMVACAKNGLECNYTSGPCEVEYLCTDNAWHHQSAVCTPMAVPWESAHTGDVCAFAGETHVEQGNCTDTWTCESDHTWLVNFGFAPDGYPCP